MNICDKQIQIKTRKVKPRKLKPCKPKKCKLKKRKKTCLSIKKTCFVKQINYYKIIKPVRIVRPVRVVAKDLDIRNLNPVRDKVEIFGSDGQELLPIRTDAMGRLEVISSSSTSTIFMEEEFLNVNVSHATTSLPAQDSRTKSMTSYAVANRGDEPIIVRVEISPNALDYAKDMQETVPPQSMRVFVPNRFLKWTRVSINTETPTSASIVDVYFQSQTTGSEYNNPE
ncbi:DUF6385 domain-containing protein [Paenibacillus macquariensis]|uniref:DUF6385 domain-containing protein n=1 Tax=Paenibacillus macquariensis TaxID=948756 RepID=A0ABY1KBN2_9BACL|nr:DUF6385 domain-containing protein [Paenibacillus macquariensis]MEC0094291.1 DUF6385 domain-containing protein [Paenibacillus macquariensis]OAB25916.1 hypothetical protein PMSM_27630 [Paenibacillus macquariensis subsp. macquariensis]SIR55735.1 hypothetical protein SAMN05421578_11897 [Paenibacillus macquariensis]